NQFCSGVDPRPTEVDMVTLIEMARPYAGEADLLPIVELLNACEAAAWVEMFNQSFVDHWNHHPLTVAQFLQDTQLPYYRKEQDLVCEAADGMLAAFCYCCIEAQENERSGRNEGWIATLGARRGFRKLGLGRAMLLAGLQRLKADGVETAVL